MTPEEYLNNIIKKYSIQNWDADKVKGALLPTIRSWAGDNFNDFFVMGSFAKGTGIAGSGDIDFFISIDNRVNMTLKSIYDDLYSHLEKNNLYPKKQNVSIRINFRGIEIDLVPGRTERGYQNYHTLFSNKSHKWIETNVKAQTELISKSRRNDEIKCLKVWRMNHELDFPSYYLELTALKALKGNSFYELSPNFITLLRYLSNDFVTDKVIDLTKESNIVSDLLSVSEKKIISETASQSLSKSFWENILW